MALSPTLAVLACAFFDPAAMAAMEELTGDIALLKTAKVATDGPGLLEFFKKRAPVEANAAHVEGLIAKLASRKFRERQQAAAELLRIGLPARPLLVKALKHEDIEVVRRV